MKAVPFIIAGFRLSSPIKKGTTRIVVELIFEKAVGAISLKDDCKGLEGNQVVRANYEDDGSGIQNMKNRGKSIGAR